MFIIILISVGALLALIAWLLQPAQIPSQINTAAPDPTSSRIHLTLNECKRKWYQSLQNCPFTGERYLIIGCGFLGTRIIESLLQRGEKNITIYDNNMKSKWRNDHRVIYVYGNIINYEKIRKVCIGIDTVYCTAASIRFMDKLVYQYSHSYDINVTGTYNIIKACKEAGVKYIIQTSTAHVTVPTTTQNTIIEINETDPYVSYQTATSHYGITKALAEQIVLSANQSSMKTVSIRPFGIFGAYDSLVLQDMLQNMQYMFLGFSMLLDWEYVDNVAYAHLLAEAKLREPVVDESLRVDGKAFLLTDNKAMYNNDFRSMIIHYCPSIKAIAGPPRLIWVLAYIIEALQRIFTHRFPKLDPPLSYLTPTALRIMDMDMRVNSTRAKDVLGYSPVFTVEEGIQLSIMEYMDNTQNVFHTGET